MSKLSIDGHIIGTDADKVDYNKNNAATVEDALDALFQGAGGGSSGDEISNADLAFLVGKMVEKSGIDSAAYTAQFYSAANNLSAGSTFATTLGGVLDYGDAYACHMALDINEGEVLHYAGIGYYQYYGYVICDADNKVLAFGAAGNSSGEVTAPSGSRYVYINGLQGNKPKAWVTYTNRPHIKTPVGVYQAFGDSITTDDAASNRPVCYPRLLADKFGAKLSRASVGGAHISHLGANIYRSRCDADLITICYGANDAVHIAEDASKLGSASAALEILPADGSLSDLTSSQLSTLQGTRIGYYRWCLAVLLETYLIKPNVRIFCIGPFGNAANGTAYATALANFRTQLKALVDGLNDTRIKYINGAIALPYIAALYQDSTHPNEAGQVMAANGLYAYIAAELGVL